MHRRALLAAGACAFAARRARAAAPVSVVATFSVLGAMTKRIGGDLLAVKSLVGPNQDTHVYQPTADDSRALSAAAVLIENGLGLEGWMARLAQASSFHGTRVIATDGVKPRYMREGNETSLDPHAWQNPRNGAIYVRNIAAGLAAADPANASAWRGNAEAFGADIEQMDAWIAAQFAPIPPANRRIITTHDAFGYYGDRYGISFLAPEGISTDAEPSAKAIAGLIGLIKRENVRMVFLENMTDPRLTKMLARETGAVVAGPLYSDALSAPDGPAPDYLAMLRYNTSWFVRALRPG